MNICIFCSANDKIDADYFKKTDELGRWCARNSHTIVFGGTNQGLMECVAKGAFEEGGHVVGVIPEIVERGGRTSKHVHTHIWTNNLSDRKDEMIGRSDAIIALPGGIGTLDEVFTVLSAASIGYHRKRVILYNINGFWQKLVELMDDLQGRGMIRGQWREQLLVADTLDDVVRHIEALSR
ncbi:MAG: TIGR00730 family Rossman fold protein [Prevotella sp.]|nr:TIGR00730 family Rossman fold protein [Prevotella sp.]